MADNDQDREEAELLPPDTAAWAALLGLSIPEEAMADNDQDREEAELLPPDTAAWAALGLSIPEEAMADNDQDREEAELLPPDTAAWAALGLSIPEEAMADNDQDREEAELLPPDTAAWAALGLSTPDDAVTKQVVKATEIARAQPRLVDPRPRLTLEQRRVVFLIGRGHTPQQAGTSCGVHPDRLRRWLVTPAYQRALYFEAQSPTEPHQLTDPPKEESSDAE